MCNRWEAVNMHQRRVLTETHGENCLKGQSSIMHHGLNSTDPGKQYLEQY